MAEEKKIATGYIGNALRSAADNHTTTFADEIFDTERQKYQNEVNTDLETTGNEIKADLEAETARAKAAEQANTNAIESEVLRATEAEEANELAINTLKDKTSEITKGVIETEDDYICIEDNKGKEVFHLDENGLDAKNIKSNGKDVLTEHQDISGKQDKIESIMLITEETKEVSIKLENDNGKCVTSISAPDIEETEDFYEITNDEGETLFKVINNGVVGKKFFRIDGSEVGNNLPVVYLSPNGDDTNSGITPSLPKKSIQKVIDLGFKNLILESGNYVDQKIVLKGINGLNIICKTSEVENNIFEYHTRKAKATLNNSIALSNYELYNGVYRIQFSADTSHSYHKVFIEKSIPAAVNNAEKFPDGSTYWGQTPTYNAMLWEITNDVQTCKKMIPTLDLDTIDSSTLEEGHFTYDGSYIYFNPTDGIVSEKIYKRLADDTFSLCGITIKNCTDIRIEGISAEFFTSSNLSITDSTAIQIENCNFLFSQYSSGAKLLRTDAVFKSCTASHAGSDGFGISGSGCCSFYNCNGISCYDDGISHHDSTEGIVDGGIWVNNGKGGVMPSYGSLVNVSNIYCKGNMYGLYYTANKNSYVGEESRWTDRLVTAKNCICIDNISKDIRIEGYNIVICNSCYKTIETKRDDYTSVLEINNKNI